MQRSLRRVRRGVLGVVLLCSLTGCGEKAAQDDALQQAQAALAAKQYPVAVIALKTHLQAHADDPAGRFFLALALLETSDPVSAEKELRKAMELGVSRDKINPLLARALMDQGEYKKLLQEIDPKAVADTRERAEVLAYLGRASLVIGDQDTAASQFAKALQLQPDLPAARLGKVRIAVANGQQDAALQALNQLLASNPAVVEGLTLRARLFRNRDQLEAAANDYRQALALKPDDVSIRADLVMVQIDLKQIAAAKTEVAELKRRAPQALATNYLQALLAYREANYQDARKYAEIALTGDPAHLPALFLAAATDYQLQDYAKAEGRLRQVLEKSPMHFAAQKLLMATYLRMGQPNRASQILPFVLRPGLENDADLAALAGEVFLSNRDFHNADLFFTHAARLDPDSHDKRTALGLVQLREGKTDQALSSLSKSAADGKSMAASRILLLEWMRKGDYAQAAAHARQLVEKQPDKPEAHYLFAATLYAQGDIDGARLALNRALQINPQYFDAVASLASLDLAAKQTKAAIARYEALLAKQPGHPQALIALARIQHQQGGAPDSVLKLLERASNDNPDVIQAYLALADARREYGMLKEAEATLLKGLQRKPSNSQLLERLAFVQYSNGDVDRAIGTLFSLVEVDRTHAASVYVRIAEWQNQSGKPAFALQTLQKVLALSPSLLPAQAAYGQTLIVLGRIQEAQAFARKVQQFEPKSALGFLIDGDARVAGRDFEGARASYLAALQRSNSGDVAVRLHRVLLALGKSEDAQRLAGQWQNRQPPDATFLRYLGDRSMTTENYQSAVSLYQYALSIQPNSVDILNNSANALWQLNQRAEALARAEKAYSLAPADGDVLDTFGWMLAESGQLGKGLPLLHRASALRPGDPLIRYHLGRALLADKQPDAAKSALEEALRLGEFPGHDEARRLLKAL